MFVTVRNNIYICIVIVCKWRGFQIYVIYSFQSNPRFVVVTTSILTNMTVMLNSISLE
jgi:hypothetical protein